MARSVIYKKRIKPGDPLYPESELYSLHHLKVVLEMYTLKVYLLVFLIPCSATSSVLDSDIFKKEYLNPRSVDHKKVC